MTEEQLAYLEDAARNGAERLDQCAPEWWRHIDEEELDLLSVHQCVLGQTYGSYSEGTAILFGEYYSDEPFENGFDVEHHSEGPVLTQIWLDLILERKLQASVFANHPSCPWPRPADWCDTAENEHLVVS